MPADAPTTTPDMAALCRLCAEKRPAYYAGGRWWHDVPGNDDQEPCGADRLRRAWQA